jgi:putative Mg2+ transporter-C (MgtC) family protein
MQPKLGLRVSRCPQNARSDSALLSLRGITNGIGETMGDLSGWGSTHLTVTTIVVRLLLAAALGAAIGFDREVRNRPAGLRTHMLTAVAAAAFTVITLEVFHQARLVQPDGGFDPIRVVEAVTAGVAFLAAGTIIQSRGNVQGLTTGAAMWLAGAVGVAVGFGLYVIAVLTTVLALLILVAVSFIPVPDGTTPKREPKPD